MADNRGSSFSSLSCVCLTDGGESSADLPQPKAAVKSVSSSPDSSSFVGRVMP